MTRIISILLFSSLILASCSSTKNKWPNRVYHNTVARYNPYFNAQQLLLESKEQLAGVHQDDYTKVLDIFPYGTERDSKTILPNMDNVIKKCSKVIDKRQISKWVDDSYLLIGKAHFFKRDYYAAIETFQYIIGKYKGTPMSYEATMWIIRCYRFMGKLGEAEAVMGLLLSERGFTEDQKGEIYATAADVYIKQKKYSSALEKMKVAVEFTKKREKRIRYQYILGQLLQEAEERTQARYFFKKVIKMNPPYDMSFNARINLTKLYDPNNPDEVKETKGYLKKMLKDDKNIEFFDQVYYELGNIEMKDGNRKQGIEYYKLSAKSSKANQNQKALSYLKLADIYFAQPDYALAQAYFDSTSSYLGKDYPDYDRIMNKRNVLSDLIKNLIVINEKDSLLTLAALSNEDLEKTVDRIILERREAVLKAKESKDDDSNTQAQLLQQNNSFNQGNNSTGGWYFYNNAAKSVGFTEFVRKWGKREEVDNWRISSKEKSNLGQPGQQGSTGDSAATDDKKPKEEDLLSDKVSDADRAPYYANIPFTDKQKKAYNRAILKAMLEIGVLYKEKLLDNSEAAIAFEDILKRYPDNRYKDQVLYNLYKVYQGMGDEAKSNAYKEQLLSEYPNSKYSKVLDEEQVKAMANKSKNTDLLKYYEETYALYTSGKFKELKKQSIHSDSLFPNNSFKPKFDYLHAMSIGETESVENFENALANLVKAYPNTEISQLSQRTLDIIRKSKEPVSEAEKNKGLYKHEPDATHFYVLSITDPDKIVNELRASMSDYNKEYHQLEKLRMSSLLLDRQTQLILIKEFKDFKTAMGYWKEFEGANEILKKLPKGRYSHFVVSSSNFVTLFKQKKIDGYQAFFEEIPK